MVCCKCRSDFGRCTNCACVKAGRRCHDCLPQRRGNCKNAVGPVSLAQGRTSAQNTGMASQPNSRTRHSESNDSDTEHSIASHISQPPQPTTSSSQALNTTPDIGIAPEFDLQLPPYSPVSTPTFMWGSNDSSDFVPTVDKVYREAIHWKPNLFKVPNGTAGKAFVSELARMYNAFGLKSSLELISLKAAVLLPILLLQKPAQRSKAKDHKAALERRLDTWKNGDLDDLLLEGRTIQS